MNSLRKVLGFLLGFTLATFALPAVATGGDDDRFILVMSPAIVSGSTVTAKVTNRAPWDFLKSFTITIPTNLVGRVSIASTSPSSLASKIAVSTDGTKINGNNLLISYNNAVTLTLTVNFPAASCSPTTPGIYDWTATAKGGLIVSNETFTLVQPPTSALTTTVAAMCFVTQPIGTLAGGVIGGPVRVQVAPPAAFTGKSITLTIDPSTCSGPCPTLTNNVRLINAAGYAEFPDLTHSGPTGTFKLIASTGVAGYPTAVSSSFVVGESDAAVDCVGQPNSQTNTFTQGQFTAFRGLNKPGSTCKVVRVDYTEISGTEYSFKWDVNNQLAASFAQTRVWPPKNWTTLPTVKVKWGSVEYRPALFCLTPYLPLPYGVATEAGGTITLNTGGSLPPGITSYLTPPQGVDLDWVIGPERMTVKCTSATSCQIVTRQVGGTPLATIAGQYAMSTPLPMDSTGTEIQYMCLQSLEVDTLPSTDCTPANPRMACLGLKTTGYDLGDGFMSLD